MTKKQTPVQLADPLFHELRNLIEETRSSVAVTVNAALTMLYWRVGKRISKELLQEERAAYGAEILPTLSAKLSWSHFKAIIYLDDPLKRDFYAEMCRIASCGIPAPCKRRSTQCSSSALLCPKSPMN